MKFAEAMHQLGVREDTLSKEEKSKLDRHGYLALPYILTVILLAGFIGKAIPPRAGGVPYVKER